jgi:nucleotide-binding universal stress UspA family protein
MAVFKTIVVPVDGSAPSDAAVALAIRLGRDQVAKLYFLHISETAKIAAMVSSSALCVDPSMALNAEREAGEEALRNAKTSAEKSSMQAETLLEEGASADRILDTTARIGADLIVIGSHGRGGLSRALLGSVAEAVLRRSRVPVLVIRVQ